MSVWTGAEEVTNVAPAGIPASKVVFLPKKGQVNRHGVAQKSHRGYGHIGQMQPERMPDYQLNILNSKEFTKRAQYETKRNYKELYGVEVRKGNGDIPLVHTNSIDGIPPIDKVILASEGTDGDPQGMRGMYLNIYEEEETSSEIDAQERCTSAGTLLYGVVKNLEKFSHLDVASKLVMAISLVTIKRLGKKAFVRFATLKGLGPDQMAEIESRADALWGLVYDKAILKKTVGETLIDALIVQFINVLCNSVE